MEYKGTSISEAPIGSFDETPSPTSGVSVNCVSTFYTLVQLLANSFKEQNFNSMLANLEQIFLLTKDNPSNFSIFFKDSKLINILFCSILLEQFENKLVFLEIIKIIAQSSLDCLKQVLSFDPFRTFLKILPYINDDSKCGCISLLHFLYIKYPPTPITFEITENDLEIIFMCTKAVQTSDKTWILIRLLYDFSRYFNLSDEMISCCLTGALTCFYRYFNSKDDNQFIKSLMCIKNIIMHIPDEGIESFFYFHFEELLPEIIKNYTIDNKPKSVSKIFTFYNDMFSFVNKNNSQKLFLPLVNINELFPIYFTVEDVNFATSVLLLYANIIELGIMQLLNKDLFAFINKCLKNTTSSYKMKVALMNLLLNYIIVFGFDDFILSIYNDFEDLTFDFLSCESNNPILEKILCILIKALSVDKLRNNLKEKLIEFSVTQDLECHMQSENENIAKMSELIIANLK